MWDALGCREGRNGAGSHWVRGGKGIRGPVEARKLSLVCHDAGCSVLRLGTVKLAPKAP